MGLFDDLIPAKAAPTTGGLFADLIPEPAPAGGGWLPDLPDAPTGRDDALGMADMLIAEMQGRQQPPAMEGPVPRPAPPVVDQSSLGGDLEAAWLQAQQLIPGARAGIALQDIRRGQEIEGDVSQWPAMQMQVDAAAQAPQTLAEVLPIILEKSQAIGAIPMNPAAARVGQAETFGEGLSAAADDPLGVLRTYGVRSLGTSVPSMLAAIAGSAVAGPGGAAAAAGLTGAGTEAAMSVAQALEVELLGAGVDVSSPEAIAAYAQGNPQAFDGILKKSMTRAGVIGGADFLTAGATGALARTAAHAGKPGKVAGHVAAGGLVEPAGEGAGEALAGLATEGQINPGEVLAEIAGGAGMGVPTTAGQVAVEALKAGPGNLKPAAQIIPDDDTLEGLIAQYLAPEPPVQPQVAAQPAAPNPAEITPDPQQVVPPSPADAASTLPVVAPEPAADQPQIQPPEINAPAPEPLAQTTAAPPDAVPPMEETPEPPPAQKRPLTYLVRRAGIQIDPDGPAGKELRANGITSRTNPGLFRRGGMFDVDNIVAAENPELQQLLGVGEDGNYFSRTAIIDALVQEANGQPIRGADQAEVAARRREWQALQTETTSAFAADPTPLDIAEPMILAPNDDMNLGLDRTRNVQAAVDDAVAALGLDAIVTPEEKSAIVASLDRTGGSVEEKSAIVASLDRTGGSVEGAIHSQIVRTVLNAEAGEPLANQDLGIPGWDDEPEAGGTASGSAPAGERGAGVEPEPVPEGRGDPGAGDARRAGQGAAQDEPAVEPGAEGLPQQVIPGAERSDAQAAAAATDRAKAEVAARQQQSKMRRGGQSRVEDDESGLFGEPPVDMFGSNGDAPSGATSRGSSPTSAGDVVPPTPPLAQSDEPADLSPDEDEGQTEERAEARRPPGRLSPRFLDFSFTNKASVYGAAFRAAGKDPDEARNLPIDEQIEIVRGVLEERFGVKVEMPTTKVRAKNLVGRMVTKEKTSITTRESLDQMLDAFRNMQMLASIMGVPEKALALEIDGRPITLSLVSTSRLRGALGMFSWGASGRKITLPGRSNSFAHEWAHALDHWLTTQSGKDGLKGMLSRNMDKQGVARPLSPRAALVDAFSQIMKALYGDSAQMSALVLRLQAESAQLGADGKPTPAAMKARKIMTGIREGRRPPAEYLGAYFQSSAEYDRQQKAGGYFTDPAEMFARAFEAWVGATVSGISDLPQGFMSKGGWAYDTDSDERLALTFPKEGNAFAFAQAISELSHAMNRVGLFGFEAGAARPEDVDIHSPNALLNRLPSIGMMENEKQALRESAAAIKAAMSKVAIKTTLTAPFRGINDLALVGLRSTVGAVHAMAKRQKNPEARAALMEIADIIGYKPGSGEFQANAFQTNVERNARRTERMVDAALSKFKRGRTLTDHEQKKLRTLMIEGVNVDPAGVDPDMRRLAADLRVVLNMIWYDLKAAGIEVGYAPNYLPRITLPEKVDADPEGFLRQAAKVFALMFEREVTDNADVETQRADMNTLIRKLRAARMPTPEGETEPASRLDQADEDRITAWRKASDKAEPGLRAGVLDMLKARFADYSAENWRTARRVGHINDFDKQGPTSSFLQGRSLPPETDTIMADFMEDSPVDLIRGYVFSAARRAEYAKRFGAKGEKLKAMLDAAEKAGADTVALDLVKDAVLAATGRMTDRFPAVRRLRSFVFFYGNIALLPFAAFTSMAEQAVTGIRTGYSRDTIKSLLSSFRMLASKGNRQDMFEVARVIGLMNNALRDNYMESRTNADSMGLTKGYARKTAAFYKLNMLSPLTNWQRVATIPVAHAVIMRHLRGGKWLGMVDQSGFSDGELNELGIAKADRADLLQWLEGFDGPPTPDDLLDTDGGFFNKAAELWSSAVVRLVDSTIQNPLKSDRAILSNDPNFAAFYAIMSFIQATQRNIINRTIIRGVNRKETSTGKAGQVAANLLLAAAPVTMLFVSQLVTTIMREALLNGETWKDREDDDELWEWLLSRAFSRTGLTGVADPLVQLVTGVKYETDIANFFLGAYNSAPLRNIQKIMSVRVGRNSQNTNTAEYNAAAAAYSLVVQPAIMALLASFAPTRGLLSIALGTAPLLVTSAQPTKHAVTEALTGEKGESYKDTRGGAAPWWEAGSD